MNAWVRAAGKLARYEHIGWNEWPHRRCWAFHSGWMAIAGSSSGSSRASWAAAAALGRPRLGPADMGVSSPRWPGPITGRRDGARSVAPVSGAERPLPMVIDGRGA